MSDSRTWRISTIRWRWLTLCRFSRLTGGQILWHLLGTNDKLRAHQIAAVRWVGRIACGVLMIVYLEWIPIILLAIFWGIFEWLMWALARETDGST